MNKSKLYWGMNQHPHVFAFPEPEIGKTYITAKHTHCVPTCATPNPAAKQLNPPIYRQHPKTSLLRIKIFRNVPVPEVTPSSKKKGEIPSED